jgi:anti-anti-sigma regulatory factor
MTPTAASISAFAEGNCAHIRITGRANFTLGVEFKRLLDELDANGFKRFVLDLSDCALMDSTFLGILTGFGLKQQQKYGENKPSVVELSNPHERVAELIENLGVIQLFTVTRQRSGPLEKLRELPHQAAQPTREETTRTCLEAHEILAAANPENAAKFKDVTRFLAEDLKRMKKDA